jgi:hypothetical protein
MGLQDNYEKEVSDVSATLTMVVMNDKRKIVRNYGGFGPTKLWGIAMPGNGRKNFRFSAQRTT